MRQFSFNKGTWKNAAKTALIVWLLSLSAALGQSGGDYELSWSTIDGGGGRF